MTILWVLFTMIVFTPSIFLFAWGYSLWKEGKKLDKDFDRVFRTFQETIQEAQMRTRISIPRPPPSPYDILNVMPFSSLEICEGSYRNLAKRYHPDNRETGDIEKMKVVNVAIEEIRKGRSI
jgi:DnaJ-class molecular chaperone